MTWSPIGFAYWQSVETTEDQFRVWGEPQDLELALRSIADGTINVRPWLGTRIGLSGVSALTKMTDPATPVRTEVDPRQP